MNWQIVWPIKIAEYSKSQFLVCRSFVNSKILIGITIIPRKHPEIPRKKIYRHVVESDNFVFKIPKISNAFNGSVRSSSRVSSAPNVVDCDFERIVRSAYAFLHEEKFNEPD